MVGFQFFPSRAMSIYLARMFVGRTLASLFLIVIVLQTLDVLGESGSILAQPGNTQATVWHYVSLRIPQLTGKFLPYFALLGALSTYWTLNQNSEVTAMKASGLSAHQILAPIILAATALALASFAFNDRIVTRATATLNQWQKVDYGPMPIDRGERTDVWTRAGDDLVSVARVRGRGDATVLIGLTFYERRGYQLRSIVTAAVARRRRDGWLATDARSFRVDTGVTTGLGEVILARGVRPDQFTLGSVDADGLSFTALRAAIGDLQAGGRPTKALEGVLWHRISGAMSVILMPLLSAVALFGLARSGKMFIRVVIGMALGFTYFVVDNFALALGNLGVYSPLMAAWAPLLLFLAIGEYVLFRTEE